MLILRNCYFEKNIFLIIKNIKFKKINNYFSIEITIQIQKINK